MTRAEAIAACVAKGNWPEAICAETVDASMVDGVYCDGTLVIDSSGRRCVTRAQQDRRAATIARDPLPRPAPSPGEQKSVGTSWGILVAALACVAAVAWLAHD